MANDASAPPTEPRRWRPLGVTVLGALCLLTCALAAFGASLEPALAVVALLYGIMGVALFVGWAWAWGVSVAIAALVALGAASGLAVSPNGFMVFFTSYNTGIFAYLFLPSVRGHFRVAGNPPQAPTDPA